MNNTRPASTIRDVARLAQVSVATVSRYLNHSAPLSNTTAERVQRAMDQLNFTPHPVARNLATHRTHTIGVVLNDVAGDFFAPLIDGVLSGIESLNYNLLIINTRAALRTHPAMLGPMYTDGLLVFWDSLEKADLDELIRSGHPCVLIHQSPPPGARIPLVTIENKAATRRLIDHLVEVHHRRRIAFLRGPAGNEDSQWREAGYRESLASHQLPFDSHLVAEGGFDRFISQQAMRELIHSGVDFDAVFTGDDEAAIGALQALKEAEIRVPEEVSVAGFDDQSLAPFLTPPLTTVHAPTDEVGRSAARTLLRLINGESVEPELLLPTELVIRASCGCPLPVHP
jgi:DNA-binding LacI/PurR family transcriptional regulator